MRVTDNASLLQTEIVAVMRTLSQTSLRKRQVVMYTDPWAAIDSIQQSIPNDIYLLTNVLNIVQKILAQG